MRIQAHVIAKTDACGDHRRHITRILRRLQALGCKQRARVMKLQPRCHRRNVGQRFHRMDAGTMVAAAALPGCVPAAMLDVIERMPPTDVLGGLEEVRRRATG
ncbi:hypothetical protein G6F40_016771 [Rhizopus arrhizus]|nr:hypothetical protein G6F40_016771 [Rhizopus arrhizus]